jgi:hypothetical protein
MLAYVIAWTTGVERHGAGPPSGGRHRTPRHAERRRWNDSPEYAPLRCAVPTAMLITPDAPPAA